MRYIDDCNAGKHCMALHSAAKGFSSMHTNERFYLLAYDGMGPELFQMSARTHHDRCKYPLLVKIGSDPEEAILTALEEWWADRCHSPR